MTAERWIDVSCMRAARHHPEAHRQETNDRLDDAGSAEGVSGDPFRRAAWCPLAEHADDGLVLRGIADGCPGAVQVYVVDVLRPQARRAQRLSHGNLRAKPFWMGCRHMIGVGALANAEQENRVVRRLAVQLFDERETGTLADRDAAAGPVERPARLLRNEAAGTE